MGCNSDYMKPTDYEIKVMESARHLLYVQTRMELPIEEFVIKLAQGRDYNRITPQVGDIVVESLCKLMGLLTPEQVEEFVYKPRTKEARALADWWEDHQAADKSREQTAAKAKLDRGYLFPKGSGVPSAKKDEMMKWYAGLTSTGQSYVNLLLYIRDKHAKDLHVTERPAGLLPNTLPDVGDSGASVRE